VSAANGVPRGRCGAPTGVVSRGAGGLQQGVTLLYHGADLVWMSKLRAGAEGAGIAVRAVRSVEMLEARLADTPVKGLIVDLDAPEVAIPLIECAAKHNRDGVPDGAPPIRIAAFGPHVEVERFAQAKAAGAGLVMPRGALAARLQEVLRGLVEG
jgi:hypothetical protein